MRINDHNPEFENAELSYRRGYQQGACDAFQLALSGEDFDQIRKWIEVDVYQWRLNGMTKRTESGRRKLFLPPRRPRRG